MTLMNNHLYLILAAPLLFLGIREAFTGRATARMGRRPQYAASEYVWEGMMVRIFGVIKLLWGGVLCLIWFQNLQRIEPNMLDSLLSLVKSVSATATQVHVFVGIVVISILLVIMSAVLARMFGEERSLLSYHAVDR